MFLGAASWRDERLLRHAHRLEHDRLDQALDAWDVDFLDPVWGFRKAALLAGVERLHDARFALRTALARVRRERRRDVDDHAFLSKEAWGMWLTLAWRTHRETARGVAPDESDRFERWRDLSLHDCNAMGDYRELLSEMLEPLPHG